jgi:phosphomethylpyrimidine synthase
MEITQQVRDYASKLNERQVELDKATTVIDPEAAQGSDPAGLTPSEAQAGMAEMSQRFRDLGSEVYVDADKVKAANKALG